MEAARKDITFYNLDDAREFVNNFLATLNGPTVTRQLQCFREDLQKIIDDEGDYQGSEKKVIHLKPRF